MHHYGTIPGAPTDRVSQEIHTVCGSKRTITGADWSRDVRQARPVGTHSP